MNLEDYSHQYIKECFDYDPDKGTIFWKERPRRHFETQKAWKMNNTTKSGKPASRFYRDGSSTKHRISCFHNISVFHVIHYLMTGFCLNRDEEYVYALDGDNSNIKWENVETCKINAAWDYQYPISEDRVINKQYVKDCFEYDAESGEVLYSHNRPKEHFSNMRGYREYLRETAGTVAGYKNGDKKNYLAVKLGIRPLRAQVRLHNVAWLITYDIYPPETGLVIDHINRKADDNRINNLRLVSQSDNCRNTVNGVVPVGVSPGIQSCKGKFLLKVQNEKGDWEGFGTHDSIEAAEKRRLEVLKLR